MRDDGFLQLTMGLDFGPVPEDRRRAPRLCFADAVDGISGNRRQPREVLGRWGEAAAKFPVHAPDYAVRDRRRTRSCVGIIDNW